MQKGKSFHSFAPVYEIILKPYVVVWRKGWTSCNDYHLSFCVWRSENSTLKHVSIAADDGLVTQGAQSIGMGFYLKSYKTLTFYLNS